MHNILSVALQQAQLYYELSISRLSTKQMIDNLAFQQNLSKLSHVNSRFQVVLEKFKILPVRAFY